MRERPSLFTLLPMSAVYRILIYGLQDLVLRSAKGVDDLGMSQGFIEAEDFGTDLLAIAASNALIDFYHRDAPGHLYTP
jgi:hypothetical protein